MQCLALNNTNNFINIIIFINIHTTAETVTQIVSSGCAMTSNLVVLTIMPYYFVILTIQNSINILLLLKS